MNRLVFFALPALAVLLSTVAFAEDSAPRTKVHLPMISGTSWSPATLAAPKNKKDVAAVQGQVLVIHASNAGKGVDAELKNLSQLKHPPFSSYDTYHLLNKQVIHLTRTNFAITKLPNGRELKTSLKDVLPDGRYQIVASVSRKKKNEKTKSSFLPLLRVTARAGETFFVAGQSYKKGILVIGIRVGSAAKGKGKGKKRK